MFFMCAQNCPKSKCTQGCFNAMEAVLKSSYSHIEHIYCRKISNLNISTRFSSPKNRVQLCDADFLTFAYLSFSCRQIRVNNPKERERERERERTKASPEGVTIREDCEFMNEHLQ